MPSSNLKKIYLNFFFYELFNNLLSTIKSKAAYFNNVNKPRAILHEVEML